MISTNSLVHMDDLRSSPCARQQGHFHFSLLTCPLVGTPLLATGTGTLNQYIERRFEAQMRRAARRLFAADHLKASMALHPGSPLSSSAAFSWHADAIYAVESLFAGSVFHYHASVLALQKSNQHARRLLLASIAYLRVVFALPITGGK
jgi:heme O synthase-like polyprenyltransferase